MPRARLVLLLWVFGVLVLLGAWALSLYQKTFLRYSSTARHTECSIATVAGSVELSRRPIWGKSKTRLELLRIPHAKDRMLPPPTYKFGRFLSLRQDVQTPYGPDQSTTIEFPLWILILLWSLFCLPIHQRYLRRQHAAPPGFLPPPGPSPEG